MTEVLLGPDLGTSLQPDKVPENSLKNGAPRSEFFLMTGDKMIILSHKLSPRYAEMHYEQLPPTTETADLLAPRKPFDDFPTLMQENSRARRFSPETAVPASQSESGLHEKEHLQDMINDEKNSSVTVNMDRNNQCVLVRENGSVATVSLSSNYNNFVIPHSPEIKRSVTVKPFEASHSEPNSPAKASVPILNNFVSTVRCPSPSDYDRISDFDTEAPIRLAKRLFTLDGFKKEDVAAHLSKLNEFGISVAEEYCTLFNFSGIRLDAALRDFLSRFFLTGETQERARIIEHFAKRYHECNPTLFKSIDQVHALTCALLLLNSDLHGPNVGRRMSSRDFVDNLGQTDHIFDCSLLKTLYLAIKEQPIKWVGELNALTNDVSVLEDTASQLCEKKKKVLSKSRSTVGDDDQIEYKSGWVVKKCLFDRDGKRTPFGRRGWKMVYARLRGMVLYLHKDENGFRRGFFQTFNNAILLHHALAEKSETYSKRQHVFKLRTANFGETLFQTSDPNEVQQWVDTINYVAAAFSSPALPAPVSNQTDVFHKPLLPSAPSSLSISEQLKVHEEKEEEMRLRFEELMKKAPSLKAKGHVVQEFFYKEHFLHQEKKRYQRYAEILREHLSALSPSHSMAIRVDPLIGIYRMGDTRRSPGTMQSKVVGYTGVVEEEPEAEAKAEKAEAEDSDLESINSDTSTSRYSYQEAILQNPGSSLVLSK
ncbi:unnamed protein product [Thelazia callipaeda]|uniref:SEC7 domain-containing protein n=1 Tax=Thelazia callipaeda TaxID=103827 RepID=A0A0N5CUR8_THECL|nr:unnamed protein product [Thelazia callipaeda]